MDSEKSFIALIEKSIKKNWDLDALTDYKGVTLQYKDVARKIEKLHIIFEECGIKPGDKIAACSRNMSNWGVTFLATVTYGAVIVPILHEFKPDQVHNIVNHSAVDVTHTAVLTPSAAFVKAKIRRLAADDTANL